MSEIGIPEWARRLVRLSASLLDAGVDWTPTFWAPLARVEVRVRWRARLPPELVTEMKSALEMLRELVARMSATGDYLLEEAEDLAMEGRLHPLPKITNVGPEEPWPPRRARSLPSHSHVDDVGLGLSPPARAKRREVRPEIALRSLRGLVLVLESWKSIESVEN